MMRLTILILGILGASLHGAAWAGENVRVFASELLAFESRQLSQAGPPVKYSDAVGGAELRKLLDPARVAVIVGEYFEEVEKQRQASGPELHTLMQPLVVRYRKAFFENPRAYEEEYLDTLNWTILVAQRSFASPSLPSMPGSASSPEEQVAMQRFLENAKGLSNSLMGSLAKSIRDKVDRGMFSETAAKRALAMADRVAPPSTGGAVVSSQVPAQMRTRSLASGAEVYREQCIACHGTGAAGAPKQGDVAAWAPRIRSGLAPMLQSTFKGKGAMGPQSGGDFQDIELARAVVYMANSAGGRFKEPPLPPGHPGTVTFRVPPPPAPQPAAIPYAAMNSTQKIALGERTYAANCAACHQANGRGAGPIPGFSKAPTLARTDTAVAVVLNGSKNMTMPSWVMLSNEEIAEVINYVRVKFNNERVEVVTPEDVRSRRR